MERGWRGIIWTGRDPCLIGRGVAAAAQSLPLQVSVSALSVGGGGNERGMTEICGLVPVAKLLTTLTCFPAVPCDTTPNPALGGSCEVGQ